MSKAKLSKWNLLLLLIGFSVFAQRQMENLDRGIIAINQNSLVIDGIMENALYLQVASLLIKGLDYQKI